MFGISAKWVYDDKMRAQPGGINMQDGFHGAKLMLTLGPHLVVLRRDSDPTIPWSGCLDFPGGARQGAESPLQCALRETLEETGLTVPEDAIMASLARRDARGIGWFFRAICPEDWAGMMRKGTEAEALFLMLPEAYLNATDAIPHFRTVLQHFVGAPATE
ncbi:NUDIX domain-containing protein [Roseivivax sp. CAU 1753]